MTQVEGLEGVPGRRGWDGIVRAEGLSGGGAMCEPIGSGVVAVARGGPRRRRFGRRAGCVEGFTGRRGSCPTVEVVRSTVSR